MGIGECRKNSCGGKTWNWVTEGISLGLVRQDYSSHGCAMGTNAELASRNCTDSRNFFLWGFVLMTMSHEQCWDNIIFIVKTQPSA